MNIEESHRGQKSESGKDLVRVWSEIGSATDSAIAASTTADFSAIPDPNPLQQS